MEYFFTLSKPFLFMLLHHVLGEDNNLFYMENLLKNIFMMF
jgi:hypothetical protein